MSSLLPTVPAQGGYLPYFILLGSVFGVYNAIQGHLVTWQTKEIYSKKAHEVTPLGARFFGIYTFMASIVRAYAAYNITVKQTYELGLAVYAVTFAHVVLETLVFKTVKLNRASLGPYIISTTGVIWMLKQKSYYLGL